MEFTNNQIGTDHDGEIHDSQFDFYGRRIATCASDGKVKVFESSGAELAAFTAHNGPIYSLSWSHPSYGLLLATGGNDNKAIIWKETSVNQWIPIYEYTRHQAPITAVAWAPWELGLVLLVGSQDGCISTLTRVTEDKWEQLTFYAHTSGVTALSWAPAQYPPDSVELRRSFASVGADTLARIWTFEEGEYHAKNISLAGQVPSSVAWNCAGEEIVAVGTLQGSVVVLRCEAGEWGREAAFRSAKAVYGVCWNLVGRLLFVSLDEGETKALQHLDGEWVEVGGTQLN